mmetsp:Transcript_40937/g.81994  ORF Transcript_40937/g.81994 Transcript_40937/m.81994 type:complete len:302 (-) Transcript_40937:176-1081(-)
MQVLSCLGVPHLDPSVAARADEAQAVCCVCAVVDVGGVSAHLLEHLARLEAVHAHAGVVGGRAQLRRVAREAEARDSLRVRLVEPPRTLPAPHLPHLYLSALVSGSEELRVLGPCERQHCLLVHHQIFIRLIFEILAQLAGFVIPDLHKPVDASGDQVLPIRREGSALSMRLLPKLDLVCAFGGKLVVLVWLCSCRATEDVKLSSRRQQALVLLPLESLADENQQPRWRHDGDLCGQRLRNLSPAGFLAGSWIVSLPRIPYRSRAQRFQPHVAFWLLLLHRLHRFSLPQHCASDINLPQLQ